MLEHKGVMGQMELLYLDRNLGWNRWASHSRVIHQACQQDRMTTNVGDKEAMGYDRTWQPLIFP